MKYANKILTLIGAAAIVVSCQDPEYPSAVPSTTVRSATVTLINAAPDISSPLSFLVNNAEAASIAFPGASIVSLSPSVEQFRITKAIYGVVGSDTVSQKADLVNQTSATALQGLGAYTLIVTDTVKRPFGKGTAFTTNKGGLTFVSLITDNLSVPSAGNSGVRFLNLAPGSSSVFLTAGGVTLAGSLSTSHGYKTTTNFTSFTEVISTSYDLEVRIGSSSGTVVATLPATSFTDGKLYTIFLSGKVVSSVVKVDYAINVVQHN